MLLCLDHPQSLRTTWREEFFFFNGGPTAFANSGLLTLLSRTVPPLRKLLLAIVMLSHTT